MYFSTGVQLQAALNALPPAKQGSFVAFDADFYAQRYMGAYTGTLTPIDHFVQIGAKNNFYPNALFDAAFYKSQYNDLKNTQFDGADLLYHFMRYGLDEGRAPNAEFLHFNGDTYLANNPDVKAYVEANLDQFQGSLTNGAIAHYVKFGMAEHRVAPMFTASVDSPSVTEGNDGTSTLSFKITLDHAPTSALTLNVATNGAGSTASAGGDYLPVAQTVTFAAGQTVAFVNVTVNGDTVVEGNETLGLTVTGLALTASATGTGTIVNDDIANRAPVASDLNASGQEDSAIAGTVFASDADGNPVSYSKVSGPAHGALVFNADGSYTYTPNANYNGTDSFSYKANDGALDSNTATVTLNVLPVNDAPVAHPVQAATAEDAAQLSGSLRTSGAVSDVDNDLADLTFSLVSGAPGFALAANGNWTFNPAAADFQHLKTGEVTNVSATYQVSDGALIAVNTVTFTVTGTNDLPVASDVTVGGYENVQVIGQVTATDVDGDILTFAASNPINGTVVLDAATGDYIFTPAKDFNGLASFDYTANDGTGNSLVRTVTINVTDVVNVLTPNQDIITLVNGGKAEAVLGANNNLGQGDVITGGAEDALVLAIDNAVGNNNFASFSINGVGTFQVTNDDTSPVPTLATFDLSSSSGVRTLVSQNSASSVRFNSANLNDDGQGGQFVNLQALNLTNGVNVTLDVRNDDAVDENDTVNILVTDSDDDDVDAAAINITAAASTFIPADQNTDAGVEVVNLSTQGSTGEVRINDFNTPGAHTLNIDTDEDLVIGDTDSDVSFADGIENALSASVLTVDAEGSTGDIALSTEDSEAGATITGGSGNDTFFTSEQHGDEVRSGEGNDSVYAGSGDNWVDAGIGNDLVITGEDSDTVYGQEGNDTVEAGDGNNQVYGGDGYDLITVGNGSDYVDGGNENDIINAEAGGNDSLFGGNGDDIFNLGSSLTSGYYEGGWHYEDQVDGGEGNDTLNLTGDSGDANELDSVQNVELINLTGSGNFYIEVNDGSWFDIDTDTSTTINATGLSGGATLNFQGNDGQSHWDDWPDVGDSDDGVLSRAITVLGGVNNDTVVTGVGSDSIRGGLGDDSIRAGAENDTVDGAIGNDDIDMQAGDDLLIVQDSELDGNDVQVAGGSGTDTIELVNPYSSWGENVTAFLGNEVSGIQLLKVVDSDPWDNNTVTVTVGNGAADNYDNLEPGDSNRTVLAIDGSELDAGESLVVDTRGLDTDADGIDEDFNITGGSGDDTFRSGDNLDSGDTFAGGAGTDRILATGNTGGDDDFAHVSSVEIYEFDTAHAATLAANAQAAGILTVIGSTGNDTLEAGAYSVGLTVYGNEGSDSIVTGTGADTVWGGLGNDTVRTGNGDDLIYQGNGNESIDSGSGADTIVAYGTQLWFNDSINGGADEDTVKLDNDQGDVTANVNLDIVTSVERYETVDQDRIGVDPRDFRINFLNGNVGTLNSITVDARSLTDDDGDTLTVDLSGLDDKDFSFTIWGGNGNDTVIGDNGLPENLVFNAGAGNDRLEIGAADVGGSVTSDGGIGTDTLAVNDSSAINPVSDDTFVTLQSYEVLTVATGDNSLYARLGDAAEATGIQTVIGGSGNDDVALDPAFNPAALTVDLSAGGNDSMNAGASTTAVTFLADASDITWNANPALRDNLTGGSSAGDVFRLTADNGTALVASVNGIETYTVVENGDANITIGFLDSSFTGVADGSITVDARALDDLGLELPEGGLNLIAGGVTGARAFDVYGGTGNDTVTTGTGNDTVAAGEGDDTVTSGLGDDSISAGNGANLVDAGEGNNHVTAGSGSDTITSGAGNDTISSGDGDDSITSGAGNDSVTSGNGDVTAVLGDGNDTFGSGSGDSTVTGGNGADTLTGGLGADDFVYTLATDSNGSLVPANRDTVTDFESGVDHIIVLDGALGVGVTDVFFAGNGADFADVQGAVALTAGNGLADYVFQQDNHRLWVDLDDNGVLNGLDLQITLSGVTTIAAGDVVNPV